MKANRRDLYIGKHARIWISVLLVLALTASVLPCSSAFAEGDLSDLDNQGVDQPDQEENSTAGFTVESEEPDPDEVNIYDIW